MRPWRARPAAPALPLWVLLLTISVPACGGSTDGVDPAADGGATDSGDSPGSDGGRQDGGTPDAGEDPPGLAVEVVASGLEVPWELRVLPDGDLLVTERPGRLVRISPDTGAITDVARFDVLQRGEAGLMGLALDPDFEANSLLYLCRSTPDEPPENVVERYRLEGDGLVEGTPLVTGMEANQAHDGCRLEFGPDGALWVTMGDAGFGDQAQDPESLNGKVLRVTRDGTVPADNPFPDSPVYTLGHRNPQGLTFHPESGEAFISEHGPDSDDEINRLEAGGNYGWPRVQGAPGDPDYVDAVHVWSPTVAPAGAAFYRAEALPQWDGALLVVTLKEQDLRVLWPVDEAFGEVEQEQVFFDERFGRLRAVRVAPDGTVYLTTSNRDGRGRPADEDDRILRVVPR